MSYKEAFQTKISGLWCLVLRLDMHLCQTKYEKRRRGLEYHECSLKTINQNCLIENRKKARYDQRYMELFKYV